MSLLDSQLSKTDFDYKSALRNVYSRLRRICLALAGLAGSACLVHAFPKCLHLETQVVRSTLLFFAIRGAENAVLIKFMKSTILNTKMIQQVKLQAESEKSQRIGCSMWNEDESLLIFS